MKAENIKIIITCDNNPNWDEPKLIDSKPISLKELIAGNAEITWKDNSYSRVNQLDFDYCTFKIVEDKTVDIKKMTEKLNITPEEQIKKIKEILEDTK